jgi:hypothetical protein
MKLIVLPLALAVWLIPSFGFAQQCFISWHKVAGGDGNSSGTNGGSVYSMSGNIGQPDAGGGPVSGPVRPVSPHY